MTRVRYIHHKYLLLTDFEVHTYVLLTKCEVKMAGYWLSSFFVFMDRDGGMEELAKKRTRPIGSHLDRASLVNKGFIIWLSGKFFLRDTAGSPERARDRKSVV